VFYLLKEGTTGLEELKNHSLKIEESLGRMKNLIICYQFGPPCKSSETRLNLFLMSG